MATTKRNKIADRIINGYLTVKVPIGYAFIRRAKGLIESKLGESPSDDELESIASRLLDLVLYALSNEGQPSEGQKMPSMEDFFQIAQEVMHEDDEDEEEGDDEEDEEAFDQDGAPERRF